MDTNKYYDFGEAVNLLKRGYKVARKNWNGKGMFVYYVPPGTYAPCTRIAQQLVNKDGLVGYRDYIALKTVDGLVVPWVASQTDILAEDWYIVKDVTEKDGLAGVSTKELLSELKNRHGVVVRHINAYKYIDSPTIAEVIEFL